MPAGSGGSQILKQSSVKKTSRKAGESTASTSYNDNDNILNDKW